MRWAARSDKNSLVSSPDRSTPVGPERLKGASTKADTPAPTAVVREHSWGLRVGDDVGQEVGVRDWERDLEAEGLAPGDIVGVEVGKPEELEQVMRWM
jgi:hypothetical protein